MENQNVTFVILIGDKYVVARPDPKTLKFEPTEETIDLDPFVLLGPQFKEEYAKSYLEEQQVMATIVQRSKAAFEALCKQIKDRAEKAGATHVLVNGNVHGSIELNTIWNADLDGCQLLKLKESPAVA